MRIHKIFITLLVTSLICVLGLSITNCRSIGGSASPAPSIANKAEEDNKAQQYHELAKYARKAHAKENLPNIGPEGLSKMLLQDAADLDRIQNPQNQIYIAEALRNIVDPLATNYFDADSQHRISRAFVNAAEALHKGRIVDSSAQHSFAEAFKLAVQYLKDDKFSDDVVKNDLISTAELAKKALNEGKIQDNKTKQLIEEANTNLPPKHGIHM